MMTRLAWVAFALTVGGCTGDLLKSNVPVPQVYVLRATAPQNPNSANSKTLRVGHTTAAPGLDSDRIVLIREDHRMDHYAASRWPAPVSQLVEALAVETMRASGNWSSVNDSQGVFAADYFLQITVRRFESDYTSGGDPKVHVILDCSFGGGSGNALLASFAAEGEAAASANRLSAVVGAFEQATNAALATVAQRLAEAAKADAPLKTSTVP